jgi:ubiquinone/menaquinone biosynthesis C-methylase UbiE
VKWIYRHPRFYDLLDTLVSVSLSDRVRRKALHGLKARSLLEIGVGTGKNLAHLTSLLSVGIDTSRQMLTLARARFPGTTLVIGDAHSLPFCDGSMEVSLFFYCMAVLASPVEALKEALRVSSRVIVIDYDRPRCIPRFLWNRVAARFGFRVFGSRPVDFESLAALAETSETRDYYGGLYRVMVMNGAVNA